ncbi:MAG: hypothetical protein RL755_9 [Pseudomonadota bacterium]|jgi:hypothetical protein
MRYYAITITPKAQPSQADRAQELKTGVPLPASGKDGKPITITSLKPDGKVNLNALNVEIDIPLATFNDPEGMANVKIYGISIEDIMQAADLNGGLIEISGGMSKGLPLANPDQAGVLLVGTVYQAFGNWIGDQMTLDLIVQITDNTVNNFVVNWKAGSELKTMVQNVLTQNYPGYQLKFNVRQAMTLTADETGAYQSIYQFAYFVKRISQHIIKDYAYPGVDISVLGKTFLINDGTTKDKPKQIQFIDLIGQPTWLNYGTIQFKCPMRADLHFGDFVSLPEGAVKLSGKSFSQLKKGVTFQGTFQIQRVRHVGNFRQADAGSWCTVIDALQVDTQ